jgi:hypothetical protein
MRRADLSVLGLHSASLSLRAQSVPGQGEAWRLPAAAQGHPGTLPVVLPPTAGRGAAPSCNALRSASLPPGQQSRGERGEEASRCQEYGPPASKTGRGAGTFGENGERWTTFSRGGVDWRPSSSPLPRVVGFCRFTTPSLAPCGEAAAFSRAGRTHLLASKNACRPAV